jgi:hypothetical protein
MCLQMAVAVVIVVCQACLRQLMDHLSVAQEAQAERAAIYTLPEALE